MSVRKKIGSTIQLMYYEKTTDKSQFNSALQNLHVTESSREQFQC